MAKAVHIASFVSSHGLGHAARSVAVMEAIRDRVPSLGFDIFTSVPEWFFKQTLSEGFAYHGIPTDVGLKQRSPFEEDLAETLTDLDAFFPFKPEDIHAVGRLLKDRGCRLILCDISPMGIVVGVESGIPSLLVENFTWDWIYQGYADREPKFFPHIEFFKSTFAGADYHIQTEPVCRHRKADLTTAPISRKPRSSAETIRQMLGINCGKPVIHITMGGIPQQYAIEEKLTAHPDLTFILSGSGSGLERTGNVVTLPYHSTFYHPDIINAADLVVGKAGYSTLAEVYYAGIPFVYVQRPTFRESDVISNFAETHMHGMAISRAQFDSGEWIDALSRFLDMPVIRRREPTGADQVAEFVTRLLYSLE